MSDCKTCGKWSQYEGCVMGIDPEWCDHYERDERLGEDWRARSDEQIYCATFGAMVARQVMDHMATGMGAPEDDDMDRFVEEANTVAMMTLAAVERRRTEYP